MATSNRDATIYARLSYPALFVPRKPSEESDKLNYSATLLIPKDDQATIQRINAAVQAAVQMGVETGKFKQTIDPQQTKYPPLRDGDSMNSNGEPRGPEFSGHYFIAAKSPEARPPFIVDGQLNPIITESEVYAGCYVHAAIQFFPYSHATGGKGISTSLVGIQKVKDGDPLGGVALEAADVFSALGNTGASPDLGF